MNSNPQQESPLVANQTSVAQQGGPSCCAPQNKNQPGVSTASNNTETTMTTMVNNAHQVKEHFKINYNEQIPKKKKNNKRKEKDSGMDIDDITGRPTIQKASRNKKKEKKHAKKEVQSN